MATAGWFVLGIVCLLLGGDSVLKGAAGLAQRLGLSPFAAGVLLVAFATSIPELAVNAYAVAVGDADLALGNAVGSNVVNIGLTLGLAALAAPLLVTMRLIAADIVLIVLASGAVLLFGLDGVIARWEGGLLLAGFVGFLVFAMRRSRGESAQVRAELTEFADTRPGLGLNLSRLLMAGLLLFFGARLIVQSAPAIGQALGLGSLVTGLTLVAVGTALPEAAAAVMAARRGQANIVAGHALGACVFNLLFVVGGMALVRPVPVPLSFAHVELPAAMAFALVLYPMLGGDLRLARREGAILLTLFVGWLGFELFSALT